MTEQTYYRWSKDFLEAEKKCLARISSGKLANLANSVSEKIDAGTAVSSDWSRGFPSLSLRYRL